jgi:predicted nucleotidyltransferase
MYIDCDHLIDDHYIYTIRGNWKSNSKEIFVKPVYHRSIIGERYNKIVDQKGSIGENMIWINPYHMTHVPCKGIRATDYLGQDIWSKMVREFISIGISETDIGVFGSKRLGFKQCKDVDFIIYGTNNMLRLKKMIATFKKNLNLYNHTIKHAVYQAEVHGKHFDRKINDLLFCLLNKWSTCAFTESLTTTIRFVDTQSKSGQMLRSLLRDSKNMSSFSFKGVVSNSEGTSFMPRTFTVSNGNKSYNVFSPLWIFHQCVKNNDLVKVTGWVNDNTIILRRYDHGITFI